MRSIIVLAVVALSFPLWSAKAVGQACPANATQASFSVWAKNSIKTGQTVTGAHRCGRKLRCTGGTFNVKGSRSCSWL